MLRAFGRQKLVERPAGCHRIEVRYFLEIHRTAVDPDSEDPILAADHGAAGRPAHQNHDVARPIGGAEQQKLRTGEPGGDRNQMIGEIGHQRLGPDRARADAERQASDQEQPERWLSAGHAQLSGDSHITE